MIIGLLRPLENIIMTFAEKIIQFNKGLSFSGRLPYGIKVMNPFKDNSEIISISEKFYKKFYDDDNNRRLILGINPGRLGAGATGIPFTDSKRLTEICGITIKSVLTHEPSSVFVYDLINKYGGAQKFFREFYINSVCPLGFIESNNLGNSVNCNYYDNEELFIAVKPFIVSSLKQQIDFGINRERIFVFGKKNAQFLNRINDQEHLFQSIIVFDHPRYIEQYKSKQKDKYLLQFLEKLTN